jgi:hypothetical protein
MTVESETHAGRSGGILPPRDARGRRPGNGNLARKVIGNPRATRNLPARCPLDRLFKRADKNKQRAGCLEHFSQLWQRGHRSRGHGAKKRQLSDIRSNTILGYAKLARSFARKDLQIGPRRKCPRKDLLDQSWLKFVGMVAPARGVLST